MRVLISKVRKLSSLINKGVFEKLEPSISGNIYKIVNPYDNSTVTTVPDMDERDTAKAITTANSVFPEWKSTTAMQRAGLLEKWHDSLLKQKELLAQIITAEVGKPMKESLQEVDYGNSYVKWFSEESRRIRGEIIASPVSTSEFIITREPIGVAALISPNNFPFALIAKKAAAALAAGCTCVLKPSSDTPLSTILLAQLAIEVGFPRGAINVITSSNENSSLVGSELAQNTGISGLSFTGSTEIGKVLYQLCATRVKRLSLELGGNAPFIVFETAKIDEAVEGAMVSKFRNCGQTCVSANRFLIHETVFDSFICKLKESMDKSLILGNGTDPNTTMGPMINNKNFKKVSDIVCDAIEKGATVVTGGCPASHVGPRFYEPTILTNITSDMRCYSEEIFGPVVTCFKFVDEKDAIQFSNSTRSGLAAYFFSNSMSQIKRIAKQLQFGMIGINEGLISHVEAPFGGIKESGFGREGSHYGTDEYTYMKYMCLKNALI